MQNGEFGGEITQFFFLRLDEHVARKKVVPGVFVDHANRQAETRIRTGKAILNEQFGALEICAHFLIEALKYVRADGAVYIAPIDICLGAFFFDDEAVQRGTTGMFTRQGNKCTAFGDFAFIATDRMFIKACGVKVPMNGAKVFKAMSFKAYTADNGS